MMAFYTGPQKLLLIKQNPILLSCQCVFKHTLPRAFFLHNDVVQPTACSLSPGSISVCNELHCFAACKSLGKNAFGKRHCHGRIGLKSIFCHMADMNRLLTHEAA